MQQPAVLYQSELTSLPLVYRGKVRDVYAADDRHLLIVASDRLSAFDVVLPTPIPGKGALLTALSNFWFEHFADVAPNHLQLATRSLNDVLPDPAERRSVEGRAVVACKLEALPVEAIVRGYLIGSGWTEYQQAGSVCGIDLAPGLRLAESLPEPIFTPSTKAAAGEHDENIRFSRMRSLVGSDVADEVRRLSLLLYREAACYAADRGIIIADTKFEFGLDDQGRPILMDEVLTPDSSRFWSAADYTTGVSPASFDKQFVRDYLDTLEWDKSAPGPILPPEIAAKTAALYKIALSRLTDNS